MSTFVNIDNLDKEMGEYIEKMDYHRSTSLSEDEQQERLVDILTNGYPKPHSFYDKLSEIDFSKIDFTKFTISKFN